MTMSQPNTTSNALWSMVERFSKMGIQILCTFVIAQFVPPAQFGLVSMMSIFLAFSTMLIDSGFGQAIIREQHVTALDKSSLFWFNVLLGLFTYVLFFAAAPVIARFYGEPQLTILIRTAFLALIFQSLVVIQQALFFKSVNFKMVSKVSLLAVFLSGVLGIVVSYFRRDAWGIVAQNLSFAIFQAFFFWFYSKWRPAFAFSWDSIRKYLKFSMNLLGSNLLAAITDNLANLVVGKAYSSTILGQYTMANKIPYLTAGTLSYAIHRVSYSVMATFQEDEAHLKAYSQRVVGTAFWIIGPIMVLLFIFANEFISLLFPLEWMPAATYLRYFCVIGFVFCFSDINQDILLVRGRSDLLFKLDLVRRSVKVIIMLVGINYSVEVFLSLLTAYNILNAVVVSFLAGRLIHCNLLSQLYYVVNTPFYWVSRLKKK